MVGESFDKGLYYETSFGSSNNCLPCNDSGFGFGLENNMSLNENEKMYMSSLGIWLSVPEWEAALTAVTLSLIIILTLVGNVLVILSVFIYRPLRCAVPNFFIVSLALADIFVAVLVLPLNVAYSILGRWIFGKIVCELWVTSDVLCCTASILHLCAIAVDRYNALTDPINYARKRTLKRVLYTIAIVWIMSFLICSPPLLGWNDWPAEFKEDTPCTLSGQQGYIIFSALGSFYIPLIVMTSVYVKIFIATRRRLRQRAKASRLSAMARKKSTESGCGTGKKTGSSDNTEKERSSVSSGENGNNEGGSGENCFPRSSSLMKRTKRNRRERRKHSAGSTGHHSHSHHNHKATIEVENNCGGSSNCNNKDETVVELGMVVPEYDSSRLSPANNISEDSVTDAEIPLHTRNHTAGGSIKGNPSSGAPTARNPNCKQRSFRQTSQQVSQFVEEKQRISLSRERKAARTLGIIMGTFVVMWLPFFLMYVILPFCSDCAQPSAKLTNFITWLGYVNSSLNPIIYTIFNMDFRKAFKKILHIGKV